MEHSFTADWFTHNIDNFNVIKEKLGAVDQILEIGCFEGRATCWMLENFLSSTGSITCADPFTGLQASSGADKEQLLENRFNYNTKISKGPNQTVNVLPHPSYNSLAYLIINNYQFDFIYLDGDHSASAVMTDACMAWGLLKPGGIMLLDDYFWNHAENHLQRPKMGIDNFINMFMDELEVISVGYQVAVKKLKKEKNED
jgi:hypothetical protein